MLLRHSLSLAAEAEAVEAAVHAVLSAGCRTADLGGALSTRQMADEVIKKIA
jgi:3-isopropylmalate dehydrogenase